MKQFTYDDLPEIISSLSYKIDNIEKLLLLHFEKHVLEQDELLTISEAAELLKLSVATIYTKVCKNEIPANKQGKRLYFYRTELINWIKSGRIKTISEIRKEMEEKFPSQRF